MTIYTIGHSTRTLKEFIAILKAHGIGVLVDIRSYPASRRMRWFQGPQLPPFMSREEGEAHEALETTLPRLGIGYRWMRELGGRRKKLRDDSPHTALHAPGFRNYADYMMTPEFRTATCELLALAEAARTCIMCAEAQVYWHCHRMLVSDYLTAHGHTVLHISGTGPAKPHKLTPEARIVGGRIIYDGGQLELDGPRIEANEL
ncbi:MAG: DUF488 family protein [Terriglobales bacterium]